MPNMHLKVIFPINSSVNIYSFRVYVGLYDVFSSIWHTCVLEL